MFRQVNEETKETKIVMPPEPNMSVKFGEGYESLSFQYHATRVPNRLQRWLTKIFFGIIIDKL